MPRLPAKTAIGLPFIELTAIDSTNIYAMDQVKANLAAHGTAYFAQSQTAGKGQKGKQWLSEPGENIILSVVLDSTFLTLSRQFSLSVMVSLACKDLLQTYLPEDLAIKWPNDIYWCDRKAAGILIENAIVANNSKLINNGAPIWKFAIIGIGININQTQFDSTLKQAVSLKQITGKAYDVVQLAKELHVCVMNAVDNLLAQNEQPIIQQYNAVLYKKGQQVKMKVADVFFETTIQEVNDTGQLLTTDIIDNTFDFGTVEWML